MMAETVQDDGHDLTWDYTGDESSPLLQRARITDLYRYILLDLLCLSA